MDGLTYRWPDDYESLDRGRLLVRPDCVPAFLERGWDTLQNLMSASDLDIVRRLDARDNCRVELAAGNRTVRGYLKRHQVRSLRRRLLESGWRRAGHSPGMAEANAVGWCQAAGVPTMNVIAAGEELRGGGRSDSLFVSEELTNCVPANDHWFSHGERFNPPEKFASDEQTRLAVLRAVADTARRFHEADLFHFDFYLEHFFVTPGSEPVARLIDLQRVERRTKLSRWRAATKDLAQFYGSSKRYRLSDSECGEWMRCYLGNEPGSSQESISGWLQMQAATAHWRLRRLRRQVKKRPKRAA